MDGPLSRALARGGIHVISDVLTLMQPARDALTYQDNNGTVKPLAIGHKNLLRTLKIFANYCKADGSPIVDWTVIIKKDFDDFRCRRACRVEIVWLLHYCLGCMLSRLPRHVPILIG